MRTTIFLAIVGLAAAGCDQTQTAPTTTTTPPTTASPSTAASTDNTTPAAPDNTAVNERDASGATKTPIDQNESPADVKITAEIRQKITGDSTMSFNAQNAKIVTAKGKVTLRGPVDSAAERDAIERIAREVAGETNVDNQLEIVNR